MIDSCSLSTKTCYFQQCRVITLSRVDLINVPVNDYTLEFQNLKYSRSFQLLEFRQLCQIVEIIFREYQTTMIIMVIEGCNTLPPDMLCQIMDKLAYQRAKTPHFFWSLSLQ
jgi:hypothetical protein